MCTFWTQQYTLFEDAERMVPLTGLDDDGRLPAVTFADGKTLAEDIKAAVQAVQ